MKAAGFKPRTSGDIWDTGAQGPSPVPCKASTLVTCDNTPLERSLILRGITAAHSLAAQNGLPAKSKASLPLGPGLLNCFLRAHSYFSLD